MDKIKVLMIDDNIKLVEMIKEYFKTSNGVEISITAKDGLEGIEKAETKVNDYDLILLDLIMPNKDGLFVLEEIDGFLVGEASTNIDEFLKIIEVVVNQ